MSKKIVIGSRGSKLALLYAQMAKDKIIKNIPALKIKAVDTLAAGFSCLQ